MNILKMRKQVGKIKALGDQHRKIKAFVDEFEDLLSDAAHDELADLHNSIVENKKGLIEKLKPRPKLRLIKSK